MSPPERVNSRRARRGKTCANAVVSCIESSSRHAARRARAVCRLAAQRRSKPTPPDAARGAFPANVAAGHPVDRMQESYVERILKARVYDVAVETPLEEAPRLS